MATLLRPASPRGGDRGVILPAKGGTSILARARIKGKRAPGRGARRPCACALAPGGESGAVPMAMLLSGGSTIRQGQHIGSLPRRVVPSRRNLAQSRQTTGSGKGNDTRNRSRRSRSFLAPPWPGNRHLSYCRSASYIGRICLAVLPTRRSASSSLNSRPSCRGQVRAFTRNGNDWTRAYRRVVDACMARWSSRTSTVSPIFTLSVLPSTQRRTGSCSLPSTSCTNRLERREGAETHQTPRRQPLIGATAFLMTQSAPRNE